MTEAEHNTLRNLMGRLRQEQPREWLEIVFDSFVNGMDPDSTVGLARDVSGTPAVAIIFKGTEASDFARHLLSNMQANTTEFDRNDEDKGEQPDEAR